MKMEVLYSYLLMVCFSPIIVWRRKRWWSREIAGCFTPLSLAEREGQGRVSFIGY
jgi:hypothetical protein